MKGMILAAGMGTRLKPWTDRHPKALVPVGGVPMLQRVVEKMYGVGITDITVNVYHFADQIIDFIREKGWDIKISDERPELLETGGGLLKATTLLRGEEPVLVHNTDILSNMEFGELEQQIETESRDALLLVSERESSRKLIFDADMKLRGWHNLTTGEYRPENYEKRKGDREYAFSGIYVVSQGFLARMREREWRGKFSIIDYLLAEMGRENIGGYVKKDLELIDIGKPDSLNRAETLLGA